MRKILHTQVFAIRCCKPLRFSLVATMKSRLKVPRAVQVLEKRYHGLHETQHRQRSRQSPFLVVFVPGSVESPLIRIEREDRHGRKEHELFSVEILPASNVPLERAAERRANHPYPDEKSERTRFRWRRTNRPVSDGRRNSSPQI